MGIFTVVCTLEITGGAIYRGLQRFADRDSFISSSVTLIGATSLITLLLYIIFKEQINATTGMSSTLTLLLILQIFLSGVLNIYFSKCRYSYEYKRITFINLLVALLSPTLTLFLVKFTLLGAYSRMVAPIVVTAIITAPILISFFKRTKFRHSLNFWKFLLGYSLPLLPHFIASSLSMQIGKISVARYYGEAALAHFSVAFTLGFAISVITGAVSGAIHPWINRKLATEKTSLIEKTVKDLFILLSTSTLIFLTAVPEIMRLFAPISYFDALEAVYPTAAAVLISFLSLTVCTVLSYFGKNHFVTITSVTGALLSVSLNYFFAPFIGYTKIAFIPLVTQTVVLLLNLISVWGVLKKSPFSLKDYLLPIASLFIGSALLYLLRNSLASRILFAVSLIMILILQLPSALSLIREQNTKS